MCILRGTRTLALCIISTARYHILGYQACLPSILAYERELSHILPTFAMEADCYGRICPRCKKPLSICKRFVCPQCDKLFSTCYNRNHHLVTEHVIENELITSTGDKESSASETTNVRRSVRISRRRIIKQ